MAAFGIYQIMHQLRVLQSSSQFYAPGMKGQHYPFDSETRLYHRLILQDVSEGLGYGRGIRAAIRHGEEVSIHFQTYALSLD